MFNFLTNFVEKRSKGKVKFLTLRSIFSQQFLQFYIFLKPDLLKYKCVKNFKISFVFHSIKNTFSNLKRIIFLPFECGNEIFITFFSKNISLQIEISSLLEINNKLLCSKQNSVKKWLDLIQNVITLIKFFNEKSFIMLIVCGHEITEKR